MKLIVISDGTADGTHLTDEEGNKINLDVHKIEWVIEADDVSVCRLTITPAELKAKCDLIVILEEE